MTVLIHRRNTRGNRAGVSQQGGASDTTLLAPSAAQSPQRKTAKSPTSPDYQSRRNAVYFPTSPLVPTPSSNEQLTASVDDEIDQEQTDAKPFFFVVNVDKNHSVEFCPLSFSQDDFL